MQRRDFLKKTLIGTGGLLASGVASQTFAQGYNKTTELVQFIKGNAPIPITVPHGGNEIIFGAPTRTQRKRRIQNFSIASAVRTYEIAVYIMNLMETAMNIRPYMVLNLAHRRYMDANRDAEDAYEDQLNARAVYDEYHRVVREYINRINTLFENRTPIMFDITGDTNITDTILRRTINGLSIQKLRKRYGEEAVIGFDQASAKQGKDYSFAYQMYRHGYNMDPGLGVLYPEATQTLAGDYPLLAYGSHIPDGIDAIQISLGSTYRGTDRFEQTALDLGNAMLSFCKRYVLPTYKEGDDIDDILREDAR